MGTRSQPNESVAGASISPLPHGSRGAAALPRSRALGLRMRGVRSSCRHALPPPPVCPRTAPVCRAPGQRRGVPAQWLGDGRRLGLAGGGSARRRTSLPRPAAPVRSGAPRRRPRGSRCRCRCAGRDGRGHPLRGRRRRSTRHHGALRNAARDGRAGDASR